VLNLPDQVASLGSSLCAKSFVDSKLICLALLSFHLMTCWDQDSKLLNRFQDHCLSPFTFISKTSPFHRDPFWLKPYSFCFGLGCCCRLVD
jgi:hypothetical protein